MQRLKRKVDVKKYSCPKQARREASHSESSDSDDLEILDADAVETTQRSTTESKAAWRDSDDSSDEDAELKRASRFEKQFGPIPRFLTKKARDRHRPSSDSSSDSEEEEHLEAGTRVGKVLAKSSTVSSSALSYKRLRDVNADQPAKATASSVRFHPWSPVALVGSTDRTLNIFHVDGDSNEKLSGHYFDHFPIKCARFSPDGKRIVLSSIRRSFRLLELETEQVTAVHGLRGVEAAIQQFEISPDGRYIVFIGHWGALHVVEMTSLEKVATLEANGRVMSLAFAGDDLLYAFGDEGRVYRFSMSALRLTGSFLDDGCVGGRAVAVSPEAGLLACSHSTGIVNVYRHADTFQRVEGAATLTPKPQSSSDHLVTACDRLRFGPEGELLLAASSADYAAVRVLHTATGKALSNFPGRSDHLGKVSDVDISPGGGYLAIGQTDGRVKLLRLLHYKGY